MPISRIAFLALDRDFNELREEYERAWSATLKSGQVLGGPIVEQFEREVAAITNRKHAIAVASGTDALWVSLAACDVGPKFTVVLPALTYIATGSAVLRAGATPLFVDTDEYAHADIDEIAECLTEKSSHAVVAVGLFGNGLDGDALQKICRERGALLIEDAAQSFGSSHIGAPGGGLGLVSALSFAPTKTLPCFGSAGAVVTDDDDIAARARLLRTHGKNGNRSPAVLAGTNSVLASVHAAQLLISLQHYRRRSLRREQIASAYLKALAEIAEIGLPIIRGGCVHNWHKFVITSRHRDELAAYLRSKGIETQIHYPIPLPDETIFNASPRRSFPRARAFASRCLTLPLHPHLTDQEIERIIFVIREFHTRPHQS